MQLRPKDKEKKSINIDCPNMNLLTPRIASEIKCQELLGYKYIYSLPFPDGITLVFER